LKSFGRSGQASFNTSTTLVASAAGQLNQTQRIQRTKFEASPLDELAKLELTPDEQQIENNPVAATIPIYSMPSRTNRSDSAFPFIPMIQQFVNYYRGRGKRQWKPDCYRSGNVYALWHAAFFP